MNLTISIRHNEDSGLQSTPVPHTFKQCVTVVPRRQTHSFPLLTPQAFALFAWHPHLHKCLFPHIPEKECCLPVALDSLAHRSTLAGPRWNMSEQHSAKTSNYSSRFCGNFSVFTFCLVLTALGRLWRTTTTDVHCRQNSDSLPVFASPSVVLGPCPYVSAL